MATFNDGQDGCGKEYKSTEPVRIRHSGRPLTPQSRMVEAAGDTTVNAYTANRLRMALKSPQKLLSIVPVSTVSKFFRVLAAGPDFPVPRAAPDTAARCAGTAARDHLPTRAGFPNEPIRAHVRSPLRRGSAQAPRASRSGPVSISRARREFPQTDRSRTLSDRSCCRRVGADAS